MHFRALLVFATYRECIHLGIFYFERIKQRIRPKYMIVMIITVVICVFFFCLCFYVFHVLLVLSVCYECIVLYSTGLVA